MASEDLDELRERLISCGGMIETYSNELQAFSRTVFESRVVEEEGEYVLQVRVTKDLPIKYRTQAGMLVNEIRAMLDALAFVLATRNGKSHGRNVYFPIGKSREGFMEHQLKKIAAFSQLDRQAIIDFTPWRGADTILWNLHELDRTRKHWKLSESDFAFGTRPVVIIDAPVDMRVVNGRNTNLREFHWIARTPHRGTVFSEISSMLYFPDIDPIPRENGRETPTVDTFLHYALERVGEIISHFD